MKRRSLRARMLMMAAVTTLAALTIAAWAMAGILERLVTQGLDQRLDAQLAIMASAVRDDATVDRARLEQRLGILGASPEWRWRIAGPRGVTGSEDFPTLDPGPPHPPPPAPPGNDPGDRTRRAPSPMEGEDGQGPVHARSVTIGTSAGPVEMTAAAPAETILRPIRAALVPLLTIILVLGAIFAMAAYLQLRFGLRPVLALRDQVADIRLGEREAVDEDQPAELKPLAVELNALAGDSAAALSSARTSAANLAHALKTPVATLGLTVAENPVASAQVRRIDGVIRHHLGRARAAAVGRRATSSVLPVVDDLVTAMRAMHRDIAIRIDVPSDLSVAIDAHDLTEIVGNLLDNASRHAHSSVIVTAGREEDHVFVAIDDDGPGIPLEQRESAMTPGMRLDEGSTGYGFGLAIVRDLVTLHGGRLALAQSDLGGLRAEVRSLRHN